MPIQISRVNTTSFLPQTSRLYTGREAEENMDGREAWVQEEEVWVSECQEWPLERIFWEDERGAKNQKQIKYKDSLSRTLFSRGCSHSPNKNWAKPFCQRQPPVQGCSISFPASAVLSCRKVPRWKNQLRGHNQLPFSASPAPESPSV